MGWLDPSLPDWKPILKEEILKHLKQKLLDERYDLMNKIQDIDLKLAEIIDAQEKLGET